MECKYKRYKRMCEVLAGLGGVELLEVGEPLDGALVVEFRTVGGSRPLCPGCGGRVWSKGERLVELVDLPVFGRPVRLGWRKRRWECLDVACGAGSFTEQDSRIAPERGLLTCRAGRWAAEVVGRKGRAVSDAAEELGCDWHTVNKEVIRWGQALLDADEGRIGAVEAVGVDETMFLRTAPRRRPEKRWCTSIVDVQAGQLLDIVPGREAAGPARWLSERPAVWRERIRWAVLDLSGPYRAAYDAAIPHATQVADPFHVIRLANDRLDEVRRRVQNETLGHRGRKSDPLYRIRKLLTLAHQRLDQPGEGRLQGLLAAGDPYGEVRLAWHAKETLRDVYQIRDPDLADEYTRQLADDLQDESCPREVNQLGRTIARWYAQIVARRPLPGVERTHRSNQQPHQTDQTNRVRVPQLHQLPHTSSALRRETQLGPTPHSDSPLKSEEPVKPLFTALPRLAAP